MEKHKNALSGYNRRDFFKRSLQIGTVLSLSPYLVNSLQAKEKTLPFLKSIFDKNEFDRIGDEVWDENGPFGIFVEDEVSHQGKRMGPLSWEDLTFHTATESNGEALYIIVASTFSAGQPISMFYLSHGEIDDISQVHSDTELLIGVHPEKMKITSQRNRVKWKSHHLQTIAQPPVWHTLGAYEDQATGKEIKIDLLYKQASPEFVFYVPGLSPGRVGKGMHAPCTAEGVIYIDGKKYVIENGQTTYERCVMPNRGGDMGNQDWINGFCGDDMNFLFYVNDYGASEGFLCVKKGDGKRFINFEDIDLTITDWWEDPRLPVNPPSKWDVIMKSDRGTFEASMNVFVAVLMGASPETGRYAYHYTLSIDAEFTFPDGETVTGYGGIGTNECRIVVPIV